MDSFPDSTMSLEGGEVLSVHLSDLPELDDLCYELIRDDVSNVGLNAMEMRPCTIDHHHTVTRRTDATASSGPSRTFTATLPVRNELEIADNAPESRDQFPPSTVPFCCPPQSEYICWLHGCQGRRFTNYSNYRRHCREKSEHHHKESCEMCGRLFSRVAAKQRHQSEGRCKRSDACAHADQITSISGGGDVQDVPDDEAEEELILDPETLTALITEMLSEDNPS